MTAHSIVARANAVFGLWYDESGEQRIARTSLILRLEHASSHEFTDDFLLHVQQKAVLLVNGFNVQLSCCVCASIGELQIVAGLKLCSRSVSPGIR